LGLAACRRSRGCRPGPVHVEGLRSSLAPAHCRVCPAGRSRRRSAHPRETGIRGSASFPAAVGHTHWDWSSSHPALPLRGLTRERLLARDAGPHIASSACYCPLSPFGRRSADCLTRLLPAGSGLSRQDQTNLYHGAPLRSDDTDARKEARRCFGRSHRSGPCGSWRHAGFPAMGGRSPGAAVTAGASVHQPPCGPSDHGPSLP
jgi:hypothetical protein